MHAAAGVVYDLKPYDHVTPTLKALHWRKVQQKTEFKLCLLVHLVINNRALVCLKNLLTSTASMSDRASNAQPATTTLLISQPDSNLVIMPPLSPDLTDLKAITDTRVFWRKLKSFLFSSTYP